MNEQVDIRPGAVATRRPLRVVWISHYPIEWMTSLPACLSGMPKGHPATWQRVLQEGLARDDSLELHIMVLSRFALCDHAWREGNTVYHVRKTRGGMRAPTIYWYDSLLLRGMISKVAPDVIHAWGTERGAGLVASRLDYPYLVTMQGLMSWYATLPGADMHTRLAGRLEKSVIKRAPPVITTESRYAVDFIRGINPRVRIEQIEHAAAPVFHQTARDPELSPLRFLFLGLPDHRKGFDVLLKALDQLASPISWRLTVTADADQPYCRQVLASVKPETRARIDFTGSLDQAKVAQSLARAGMLLFPTRADTSPNAVKEAAVVGVPVVATRVGGIPDYIEQGKNGLLVNPDDPQALAAAIQNALSHPALGSGRVDTETWTRVRDYLSPERMVTRFTSLYHALADTSGLRASM